MTVDALHQVLSDFNEADAFFDHLADDVVLEFPYGPTLGLPARVEGKPAVRAHLSAVRAGGLRIGAPAVERITEGRYLAEYTGTYRAADGTVADVPLIAVIDIDGIAITRIREYWDTLLLAKLNADA
ncbi:nuclear transport factor 2 family protein [Streptomyces sp. NPDC002669]|uniref:nuclear transport factor 2 family protein n=1 Tax=Streptomyces sp. NPDC002669 TaxID=3364658 RepID=UPI00367A1575